GIDGYRLQSYPDWVSEYYTTGLVTTAVRIFRGLSIQAAVEYGLGDELSTEWMDYSENIRIKTTERTSTEVSWFGIRYEIPMSVFHRNFWRIDSLCFSLGKMYSKYYVRSDTWIKNDILFDENPMENFKLADISGPYAAFAARWRLDTVVTKGTDSWFGAYGIDLGVRYVKYSDSSPKHDNIMKPDSAFSSFQVFVIGFMKIKLLY
ncbi:MAG: hypothetical protein HOC71_04330, partial [Candidatus Latescibacteria bacterium]|nr:hypothetical protein [Candidatus Latescibacterota bacterium]